MTTNLDQGRPVIWNIGAIAASGSPKAQDLIIDVLLASASIPAVFPPVMLDVTVDGMRHQEMHVDGGTVAQAFLYPPSFSLRSAAARAGVNEKTLRASRKRAAFVIRNGRFTRPEETVKLQTIAIAKEALSTMITSSGVNDTYRMYLGSPDETELISILHRSAMISTCLTRVRSIKTICNHCLRTDIKRVAVVIRGKRLRPVMSIRHCGGLGKSYRAVLR